MSDRPYIFHDLTISLCSTCLRRVDAKVIEQEGRIYLSKRCPEHGPETVLVSSEAEYYLRCRSVTRPGQMPKRFNTPVRWGCPYDCGICTDHEQHGCLTLIEVTDRCNLQCPICYAGSSPTHGDHRSLEQIERMLDAVVANEGEPDVVQISGGEPTIHPEFWRILDLARERPIRHLMVNTNGVRIAEDPAFALRLAEYMPGFEVYLQFDSVDAGPQRDLRGADLTAVRRRALEHLEAAGVSTTLVVTLKKGLNSDRVGEIIDFALGWNCVRGVTLQPIQHAGRAEGFDPARDRLTLSEVRRSIIDQCAIFSEEDVVPVPCHPDCVAMAYALKLGGEVLPLTRIIDPEKLLEGAGNTIVYERDPALQNLVVRLFSTGETPAGAADHLGQLLCCLPQVDLGGQLSYENVFRVMVVQFLDAWNFDVRSVKKSCIHIAHTDGTIVPFDNYNLFYRDDRRPELERLRAMHPEMSFGEEVRR